MKTIKHKRDKKICDTCKHFEKRKNRSIGTGFAFVPGAFCYMFKSITNKNSTCDKWEAK